MFANFLANLLKIERRREMNELERTALNEILRTVTYIAGKVEEIDSKVSQSEEVKANASSAS